MGFRFSKSFKIAPGMRLNVSKRGLGMSGGVKGYRVGVGPRGTRVTASIPGTGLSYQKNLSGGGRKSKGSSSSGQRQIVYQQPSSAPKPKIDLVSCGYVMVIFLAIGMPPVGIPLALVASYFWYKKYKGPKATSSRLSNSAKKFENKDNTKAIELLNQAIELDPENIEARKQRGRLSFSVEDYKTALEDSLKVWEMNPSYDVAVFVLKSYLMSNTLDEGISFAQSLGPEFKESEEIIKLTGMLFINKEDYHTAVHILSQAPITKRNLSDQLVAIHYNLGICYQKLGEKDKAVKAFKRVYATDVNYANVRERLEELD